MNIVNRCAITVVYKKPFSDWNDRVFPDMPMESHGYKESYTYLVKEEMDISEKK